MEVRDGVLTLRFREVRRTDERIGGLIGSQWQGVEEMDGVFSSIFWYPPQASR